MGHHGRIPKIEKSLGGIDFRSSHRGFLWNLCETYMKPMWNLCEGNDCRLRFRVLLEYFDTGQSHWITDESHHCNDRRDDWRDRGESHLRKVISLGNFSSPCQNLTWTLDKILSSGLQRKDNRKRKICLRKLKRWVKFQSSRGEFRRPNIKRQRKKITCQELLMRRWKIKIALWYLMVVKKNNVNSIS